MMETGAFNEYATLRRVALRNPAAAFVSQTKVGAEWKDLNYHTAPDLGLAHAEYEAFEALLRASGAAIDHLPAHSDLTLDSLYVRDALVITPKGLVKPRMGKPQRRRESEVNGGTLAKSGLPVIGEITGHGKLEGGDLVWLDKNTLLGGVGYRTNEEGLRQLQKLCGPDVSVIGFDLPHYKGPSDVFHLMSVLSPVDADLAVVYEPLMPVRLVEFLKERGIAFVSVPDEEFASMGCNVLAVAPRVVILVEGNPETERRMRAAGVTVHAIVASEICRKGEGGPTCLTRPLLRK
jgi:N-dimethylarginine dimethylaminohydrolase